MSTSSRNRGTLRLVRKPSQPLGLEFSELGVREDVGHVDDPAFEGRSPHDGSAPEPHRVPPPKLDVLGRATVARRPLEQFAVEPVDVPVLGAAQPDRALDQGLEDRLDVEGRAG